MDGTNKNRRKIFLINKHFQFSFVLYTIASTLLVIAIFYCANSYFFSTFNDLGQNIGLDSNHIFFKFLSKQKSTMNLIYFVTSVLTFFLLFIFGILLSNRIAGPIYRFQKHVDSMIEKGSLEELKLREKDYFQELATSFNKFIAYMSSRKK